LLSVSFDVEEEEEEEEAEEEAEEDEEEEADEEEVEETEETEEEESTEVFRSTLFNSNFVKFLSSFLLVVVPFFNIHFFGFFFIFHFFFFFFFLFSTWFNIFHKPKTIIFSSFSSSHTNNHQ